MTEKQNCGTCQHFRQLPLVEVGECTDPNKVIYKGNQIDVAWDRPEVHPTYWCRNYKLCQEGDDND